jgi:hypothetical protein
MIPDDYTIHQAVELNQRLHRRVQEMESDKALRSMRTLDERWNCAISTVQWEAYNRGMAEGRRVANRLVEEREREASRGAVMTLTAFAIGVFVACVAVAFLWS